MLYTFLFILGTVVGSFLNVVSLRYRLNNRLLDLKIIGGRSHCLKCREKLVWYELIPIISFIIQKGRCRSCGARLFWQYPLVEMLSGLIFVAVFWHFNNFQFSIFNFQLLITIIWLIIFSLFLLLSIIDFRRYIIPNQINLLLAALGVVIMVIKLLSYSVIELPSESFLGNYAYLFVFNNLIINNSITFIFNYFAAAIFGIAVFWLIIFLSKGKAMGWGDLKLVGALGLIFGWPDIAMIIMLSFLIGGIFSALLLIRGKKKMKDAVPFGPFLIIGASLTFFFGYQIIKGYFALFSF